MVGSYIYFRLIIEENNVSISDQNTLPRYNFHSVLFTGEFFNATIQ